MEKKIKLRDITVKQYIKRISKCKGNCGKCLLNDVHCGKKSLQCWITNKDIYSDKFLNQEIKIEVPELLTPKEKKYLENVIRPFKDKIIYIKKQTIGRNWAEINLKIESIIAERLVDIISLPAFEKDKYYKNLEVNRPYIIEDLELFKE